MRVFNKKEIRENGIIIPPNTKGTLITDKDVSLNCELSYEIYFRTYDIRLNNGSCDDEIKNLRGYVYFVKSKDFVADISGYLHRYEYRYVWEEQLENIFGEIPKEFYLGTVIDGSKNNIPFLIWYIQKRVNIFSEKNVEYYELTKDNIELYRDTHSKEIEIGDLIGTEESIEKMSEENRKWNEKLSSLGIYYNFLGWE